MFQLIQSLEPFQEFHNPISQGRKYRQTPLFILLPLLLAQSTSSTITTTLNTSIIPQSDTTTVTTTTTQYHHHCNQSNPSRHQLFIALQQFYPNWSSTTTNTLLQVYFLHSIQRVILSINLISKLPYLKIQHLPILFKNEFKFLIMSYNTLYYLSF